MMAEKRPFRAYEGADPYIFVSYSHKDAAKVYPVIEKLFLSGYNVWYDQGIPNNALLDIEIARHITRCAVFLVFLSENSHASQYVAGKELPLAVRRRRRIVRVNLDGGSYSDMPGGEDVGIGDLTDSLPASCRSCERRDPAPIEVDLSQGIEIKTERLEGLEYGVINGRLYITDFHLTDEMEELREDGILHITVPESIAGFPVTIGGGAFSGDDAAEIISITLPDGMEYVGDSAFESCLVPEIHLPEMLKAVDRGMFEECENLEHIELPYGLERIESWAFEGCTSLEEIVIPETVKYIGDDAFNECTSLRYAVIAPGTEIFDGDIFRELDYYDEEEAEEYGLERLSLDEAFHIICVEGSAAHRFAQKDDRYIKLISAQEMEEKYQRPMREKHEKALEQIKKKAGDDLISRMAQEQGAYACMLLRGGERTAVDDLLLRLAEDGYRVRPDEMGGAQTRNCAALMAMLSAESVSDRSYIKSIARERRPVFPLMLDSSPVPKELSDRFIMHRSDRTEDDLLNEIRDFLSKNGCRGNPRTAQAQRQQFVHPDFDYESVENGIVLKKYKGAGGTVTIPGAMFGRPVISLAYDLFAGNKDITEVIIPQSVKYIGHRAFKECTALRCVTIPPTVENLMSEAFIGCSPDLCFLAAKKSEAAKFAAKNGFKVKYIRFKKIRKR